MIEPTSYTQFAVPLEPGDIVVLYTDSLIESVGEGGRQLGEEGLLGFAHGLEGGDPAALSRGLVERVDAYRNGPATTDDETVVVLHHNAADPPKMTFTEKVRTMGRLLGVIGDAQRR